MGDHLWRHHLSVPHLAPSVLRFGLHKGTGWASRAIRWQTDSEYSHVSFVLPSGILLEAMQGRGVVVDRTLDEARRDEVVEVVRLGCTYSQWVTAFDFFMAQIGKPYDYLAIARFLTRRDADAPDAWFCSELAYAGLKQAGIHLLRNVPTARVSPALFAMSTLLHIESTNG